MTLSIMTCWILTDWESKVQFNTMVTGVNYSDDDVTIETSNGTYRGDYCGAPNRYCKYCVVVKHLKVSNLTNMNDVFCR